MATFYLVVSIEMIMDAAFLYARYAAYHTINRSLKSLNQEKDKAEIEIEEKRRSTLEA